jgi:hypothetical protein
MFEKYIPTLSQYAKKIPTLSQYVYAKLILSWDKLYWHEV